MYNTNVHHLAGMYAIGARTGATGVEYKYVTGANMRVYDATGIRYFFL